MVNFYCDVVRVGGGVLVWCVMGDGVDVLDREGRILGRVRTRSEERGALAVNLAFGGRGKSWVQGTREELRRGGEIQSTVSIFRFREVDSWTCLYQSLALSYSRVRQPEYF